MRFSLRTFLIVVLLVAACCGWYGAQYVRMQQEQQILAELEPGVYFDFIVRVKSGDDLYEKYTDDYLFALATRYATVAEREPPGSTAARIAGASLAHLGSRYDLTLNKFIEEPRAISVAEKYFDTNIDPLSAIATMTLVRYHRLCDDIHSSQYCESALMDGFDLDCPIDVYVLVTEICSEFNYGDQEFDIEENWPIPTHPWQWNLQETAQHSYEDKIDALRRVSPRTADAYAGIIGILQECNAKPSDQQRQQISKLSNEVMNGLSETAIFRFMLKHVDEFKSHPKLTLPRR